MNIAILTIGNELTSGRTQDTNTALIARACHLRNWPVTVALAVGDDEPAIARALAFAMTDADVVIVTGGLGPTADDITTAAVARAFSLALKTDEQSCPLKADNKPFASPGRKTTPSRPSSPRAPRSSPTPLERQRASPSGGTGG
jgi:molybdenum cofactor synthesis domain-containing protein